MHYVTRTPFVASVLLSLLCSCASAPDSRTDAGNTRPPRAVVIEHLRALEEGDWERATSFLAQDFQMQMKGMPFWVTIGRDNALDMHKARKRAFPDFRFDERIDHEEANAVRVAVYLKGTHTGPLDYPIAEVPKLPSTGKTIDLPAEYFTYFVESDRITRVFGEIPEGHGPPSLKKQLGVE